MAGFFERSFGKRRRLPDLESHGFKPLRSFTTRIAGVSYENPDGTERQEILRSLRPGDIAGLVREPDNPHGSDAIAVVDPHYGQIGYIPGHIATRLAQQLDSGMVGFARIVEIAGGSGDKPHRGCAVEVLLYDSATEIPDELVP